MSVTVKPLGRTNLRVTLLGFGALEIGRDWAADVDPNPAHLNPDEAARVLNGVLDLGINFIDTAPAYWWSEEFIGRGIGSRRREFVLATKVGEHCDKEGSYYDYSARATADFIDRSLTRLQTDCIDLIQIHSAPIEVLEKGETWRALEDARAAGKVKFIGMSGNTDQCLKAVEVGGYDTVQVPFNLLDQSAGEKLLPLCLEKGIGVIVMRPLAGGKLTRKSSYLNDVALKQRIEVLASRAKELFPGSADPLAKAALLFASEHPAVSTVIAGTRKIETVADNLAALVDRPADQSILKAFEGV